MSWRVALATLIAIRVAIPIVVLVAGDTHLGVVPRYEYGPLYGDANGYYATLREFIDREIIPLEPIPSTWAPIAVSSRARS